MTSCAVYLAESIIPVGWLRNTRKIFYIYSNSDTFQRISDEIRSSFVKLHLSRKFLSSYEGTESWILVSYACVDAIIRCRLA